jgi:hypothetical protein
MMTTERETISLSADDVAALRMADSVSFSVYEGEAYIVAYLNKRFSPNPIFSVKEQKLFEADDHDFRERSRKIICDSHRVINYQPHDSDAQYRCHHYDQFRNAEWVTAANALRVGEQLTLEWVAGNDPIERKEGDWHRDELRLVAGKRVGKSRTWLIDVYVGPDNLNRMVRVV